MCSFYKLDAATRLLPGDIIMIPPESGRNRRMRLAPDSLRRKYGFRFGESIAPCRGSLERSLRTIFLVDADKPKWALVESLSVTGRRDDDSELLAANMLDAPEPYPVVSHVNITAFQGGASIIALANTALSSLPNPVNRYDYAHCLPKSPVVRAIEAGLEEHSAALSRLGDRTSIRTRFLSTAKAACDTCDHLGLDYDDDVESSLESFAFPALGMTAYELAQNVHLSLPRLDSSMPSACVPIGFFKSNPGILAYRMTDKAAKTVATIVFNSAFAKFRGDLEDLAGTVRIASEELADKMGEVLSFHDLVPETAPYDAETVVRRVGDDLDGLWRNAQPPMPAFDAPYVAAARIREAAGEVAA